MYNAQREAEEKRIQLEKTQRARRQPERPDGGDRRRRDLHAPLRAAQGRGRGRGALHPRHGQGRGREGAADGRGAGRRLPRAGQRARARRASRSSRPSRSSARRASASRPTSWPRAAATGDGGGGIGTLLLLSLFRDRLGSSSADRQRHEDAGHPEVSSRDRVRAFVHRVGHPGNGVADFFCLREKNSRPPRQPSAREPCLYLRPSQRVSSVNTTEDELIRRAQGGDSEPSASSRERTSGASTRSRSTTAAAPKTPKTSRRRSGSKPSAPRQLPRRVELLHVAPADHRQHVSQPQARDDCDARRGEDDTCRLDRLEAGRTSKRRAQVAPTERTPRTTSTGVPRRARDARARRADAAAASRSSCSSTARG